MGKVSKAIGVTGVAVVGVTAASQGTMMRERSVIRDRTASIIHKAEDVLAEWGFKPSPRAPEAAKNPESSRAVRPAEIRPAASLPPEPPPNHQFRPITFAAASDGLSAIYDQVTPQATHRLYAYGNALTKEDISAIFQEELKKAFEAAKPADGPWFTISSGNLKIPKLQKLAGGAVALGAINIYETVDHVAPVVYACKGRPFEEFARCVRVVVKKMLSDALKKLEASAPALETKDGQK